MNWTVKAIQSLRPNAEFVLRGDTLEWMDTKQTQPTEEEIATESTRLQSLEPLRIAQESRAIAYKTEADPLFFKAQRGEVDQQVWLDKVAEIRQRFPYPEPPPITPEPSVPDTTTTTTEEPPATP